MNDEWNERAPLGWDTKNAEPVAKVINFYYQITPKPLLVR